MALASTQPPLIPLRLTTREQWVLHHVLSTRIERARRRPEASPPPPREVTAALGKLESGSMLFTVPELRRTREALTAHRRTGAVSPGERRELDHLLDRIDRALARRPPRRH